jgi:Flp pilus assembly protein TadG
MTVVLGCGALSVDYGLMVADKNRLQRGCDAAALAGVSKLKVTGDDNYDTATARNLAVAVAAQNNVAIPPSSITFVDNNKHIVVPAVTTRSFFFARAIGITNKQVSAKAEARVSAGDDLSTAKSANRVVPIGITWETYNAYKNTTAAHDLELIRQNKQVFGMDDFVLFDLRDTNAKSPAFMERQITGDDVQIVNLYDYETTLNAANPATTGKMTDGIETLFDDAKKPPYNDNGNTDNGNGNNGNGNGNNSDPGSAYFQSILAGVGSRENPRVVQLIVTPSTTEAHNGTYDTQVQAFAPVYLEAIFEQSSNGNGKGKGKGNGGGDDLILRVRFLPSAVAGEGDAKPNPDAPISGIRVSGLVG